MAATQIVNPFLRDSPIVLRKKITVDYLVKGYRKFLNVGYLFDDIKEISLYECERSGFRFFYPFRIAGDSNFYEVCQEHDWYYMPWKWENEYCQKYIVNNDNVLDVGCGQGDFLKRIAKGNQTLNCVGLELNKTTTFDDGNVKILNKTIEDFAVQNENKFDVVCSFQVLEHISQVHSFLKGKVSVLKKAGHLVIAVPNNDSDFLKLQKDAYFNMPPHHMGLWHEKSLKTIAQLFDLTLIEIAKETLQKEHYLAFWYDSLRSKFGLQIAKIGMKLNKIFGLTSFIERRIDKKAHQISGHTILAVYQKN